MSKLTFKIKLEDLVPLEKLKELDSGDRKKAKENIKTNVGKFIIESIKDDSSRQMSIVTGKKWKGLNKNYKAKKMKIRGSSLADMILHNDMLPSLKVKNISNGLEIGTFTKKESLKADGHTHAGKFGISSLPVRKFMPTNEEKIRSGVFKKAIKLANDITNKYLSKSKYTKQENKEETKRTVTKITTKQAKKAAETAMGYSSGAGINVDFKKLMEK